MYSPAYTGYREYKETTLPTGLSATDPGAGFGFGPNRVLGSLVAGEIHYAYATNALMAWDISGSGSWVTLSSGGTPLATAASGGGVIGTLTVDSDFGLTLSGSALRARVSGDGIDFAAGVIGFKIDGSTLSQTAAGAKVASGGVTAVEINSSALGNGMTGGSGTTLAVSGGDGIKVSTSVEVDYAETFENAEGVAVTVRQVGILNSAGKFVLANAADANLGKATFVMCQETTLANAASGKFVLREGASVSGFSGLVPGKVYLSKTDGAITQDTSAYVIGDSIVCLGTAKASDTIKWAPFYEIEL